MVFKRRNKRSAWRATAEFFYPRTGWRRALNYISYRVKRLPDTPHKIALGFACGIMACFTPLFGLHFLLAALLAMLLRGNVLAALIGTFIGNPLTFPIIAAGSYRLGRALLGYGREEAAWETLRHAFGDASSTLWINFKSIFGYSAVSWDSFIDFFYSVFLPYFVGGLVPGFITAVAFYYFSRPFIAAYQKRRKGRLMRKLKELRTKRQKTPDSL